MKTSHLLAPRRRYRLAISGRLPFGGGAFLLLSTAVALVVAPVAAQGAPFTFSITGSLGTARYQHTATLLPNGQLLVAGGYNSSSGDLTSAELYDPASGSWMATGSLGAARGTPTATLLPNGKVLVVGDNGSGNLASAELYDPASASWGVTGSLATARNGHTATLLPNGKVLVAGGYNGTNVYFASAELYDPASAIWTATGNLGTAHYQHTATLLPNGKVLVAGGYNGVFAGVEVYDPASGTWSATGSLGTVRGNHTATLLPSGKVLVSGGAGAGAARGAERYDVGLGFSSLWQPNISTASSILTSGNRLFLTGSRFQGISQASGGNFQDSSSNYPIVQLRSLEGAQVAFLLVDPTAGWSDTAFTSLPVTGFPFGPALVTVFTNGIPSDAKYLVVAPTLTLATAASRKVHGSAGSFDINMPLSGTPGVECRTGGANFDYALVFTFSNSLVSGSASVAAGTGSIAGAPTFSGNTVTVNLTGVADIQRMTVMLSNVTDSFGQVLANTAVTVGFLSGDTTGNGVVNATDIGQTKSQSGVPVTAANFRTDINASGSINASDIGLVKASAGHTLP